MVAVIERTLSSLCSRCLPTDWPVAAISCWISKRGSLSLQDRGTCFSESGAVVARSRERLVEAGEKPAQEVKHVDLLLQASSA